MRPLWLSPDSIEQTLQLASTILAHGKPSERANCRHNVTSCTPSSDVRVELFSRPFPCSVILFCHKVREPNYNLDHYLLHISFSSPACMLFGAHFAGPLSHTFRSHTLWYWFTCWFGQHTAKDVSFPKTLKNWPLDTTLHVSFTGSMALQVQQLNFYNIIISGRQIMVTATCPHNSGRETNIQQTVILYGLVLFPDYFLHVEGEKRLVNNQCRFRSLWLTN